MLQEILYGTFVPPETTQTRSHRIGFASSFHYVEPSKRVYTSTQTLREKDPNHKSPSQEKIYKIMLKATEPLTPMDVAKKTKLTRNFCSIILATLVKDGFAKRTKLKANKTRFYAYELIKK